VAEPFDWSGWQLLPDGSARRIADDRPAWRRLQDAWQREAASWGAIANASENPVASAVFHDTSLRIVRLSSLPADDERLVRLDAAEQFYQACTGALWDAVAPPPNTGRRTLTYEPPPLETAR
jgi:hypothetical protein